MKNNIYILIVILTSLFSFSCASEDVPPGFKGRMIDRTGLLAFYSGGNGFDGPTLEPGTYYTGMYDTIRLVDCGQDTAKETLDALTKDNVQFKLDVYITFSANCENIDSFNYIINKLIPTPAKGEKENTISKTQLYTRYIRPAVGESVRTSVSPFKANDINTEREKIFLSIVSNFNKSMKELKPEILLISDVKLNNLDFPDTLEKANVDRAAVTIAKEKAIAERDKVDAQIKTATKLRELAKVEGEIEAAKIEEIGRAWKNNPEYLNYKIFSEAGSKGNMIITSGSAPHLMLSK